jgi:AcrR family transcriptional regulator
MPRPQDPAIDRAIVAATLKLLGERGFARMSMEAVAAEAGVGKPAIYRRYPDKASLVAAILSTQLAPMEPSDLGDTQAELWAALIGTCAGSLTGSPHGINEQRRSLVEHRHEPTKDHALAIERHGQVLHAFIRLHLFTGCIADFLGRVLDPREDHGFALFGLNGAAKIRHFTLGHGVAPALHHAGCTPLLEALGHRLGELEVLLLFAGGHGNYEAIDV